jgi:DNA-binding beta-propeller fold protein YncE
VNRREFLVAAALAPSTLRVAAAAARSAPGALVTCDSQSRLALVDLRTFRISGSIRTLPDPRSIERVGDVAVVCHTAVGKLSIVSRERVLRVVDGFVEPRYTVAHPDGVHAFVTDSGRSSVAVVNVRRGVVVARVRLSGWARHLTIAPDGSRLWVGLGSASEHLSVVSTAPFRHLHDLTPGFPAHDVGAAPDGRLWITSGSNRELAVGGRAQSADLAPQHVTFGNGRVFVTSGDSGTFHVQAPDGRVLAREIVPAGSYNVQFGAGRVVTPSLAHGTLAVFDGLGRHLRTVQVADSCHDACILD